MKILLVSHFFPPQRTAGAEKRTLGYAMALQNLGHSVQVVCAGNWDVGGVHWNGFQDEVYQGVPIRRVHLNWTRANDPNRALYDNSQVEGHFSDWLAVWKPDIVHVISLITLGAGVLRAAKRCGLPVIFTLTDFWVICPKISLVRGDGSLCDGITTNWDCLKCMLWNSKGYQGLARFLPEIFTAALLSKISRHAWISRQRGLRGMAIDMSDRRKTMAEIGALVDCVIAPSTNLGKVIDNSGIFPFPVRILHSGHDLAWLDTLPEDQSVDGIRFGFIGQLIPAKGVDILIRAFQMLHNCGKRSLVIYGDGNANPSYTASLQAMVKQAEDINFMGMFDHDHLGEVLGEMDVLVVPSQWHENNPRVIQEAFAAKVPVIASNVEGIVEFIDHEVNGLLFQYNSAEDLYAQLQRVLTEDGILRRLRNGIKPVKTISAEVNALIELYQRYIPIADGLS